MGYEVAPKHDSPSCGPQFTPCVIRLGLRVWEKVPRSLEMPHIGQ